MQTRSSSKFVGEPSTNPTSTNPKRRNRRCSKQRVEPFALEEPSRSILTWDDLVSKFINHFFPPSKTTNLRNEISNFHQKFEETFSEAWDRFKDLLRACPHHGFTELHQLDTFYNGLNPTDQDSLNSAAGGNLLERMPQDALKIIENKSKVRNSRNKPIVSQANASEFNSSEMAKLTDAVTQQTSDVTSAMTAMMKQLQATTAPASVKAVEESCVTCGGAHSYRQCPATDGNTFLGYQDNIQGYVSAAAVNYNQGNTSYRPQSVANQIRPPGFAQPNVQNNQNRFNQNQGINQNQGFNRGNNYNQGNQNYQAPINQPQATANSDFSAYMKENNAVMKNMQTQKTSLTNSNIELKNMFGQFMKMNIASNSGSGSLPSNTVTNTRSDLKVITTRCGVAYDGPPIPPPFSSPPKVVEQEPEVTKDMVQPIVDYIVDPRVPLILERPFLRTASALIDVYGEELTLRVNDEAITFRVNKLRDTPTIILNQLIESMSSTFHVRRGKFILEEIEACLTNDSIPPGIDDADFDPEGDLLLLEKLLNDDPSSPLPPKELHFEEIKTIKSSIDDPLELELKDLPSHLQYALLELTDKLPVIISKELKDEEKIALLKVLKSHKRAIAWKISDIKGFDPSFCTHKILMEDDFKLAVQH
ncbi:reverse transcriptase domain-containing protein [Tanacetum coccineum]